MANIGPSPPLQYLSLDVYNGRFPAEGPKIIPVSLNFALQQSFNVDLTLAQQTAQMRSVQAVWYDNSQNATPVTILSQGTQQNLILPGHSQGCLPIFQTVPSKFTVTCTGGAAVLLQFINVPLPACVWPTTAEPSFTTLGYLQTSDVALDAIITSNSLAVTMNGTGNNNVLKPFFIADELFSGSVTAAGNSVVTTGAPSYFITEAHVYISADASLAAAGELTVQLRDNATVIATGIALLPNAGGTAPIGPYELIELENIQFNSKASTVALNLNLSAALTGGHVYYNIAGGLCSNIGP